VDNLWTTFLMNLYIVDKLWTTTPFHCGQIVDRCGQLFFSKNHCGQIVDNSQSCPQCKMASNPVKLGNIKKLSTIPQWLLLLYLLNNLKEELVEEEEKENRENHILKFND